MSVNILTDFQGNQLPLANDNLLINGDFQINQRGQTIYTTKNDTIGNWEKVFSFDRWYVYGTSQELSVTVNEDKTITVQNIGNDTGYFIQPLENALELNDYTLSANVVNVSNVKMYFEDLGMSNAIDLVAGYNAMTQNGSPTGAVFLMQANSSVTLKWVKLEQGSIATPLVPRLYAEELYLCKRYCLVLSDKYTLGTVSLANTNTCYCALKHHLRSTPTLTYDGGVVVNQNGQTTTVANITLDNELSDSENLFLYLKCSTGNTFSSIYCGFAYCQDAGRKLIFDSEIK